MEITKEQNELLKKPLPKEAVSPHPTKTYLSTIKAIYVVERLNEVFGTGAWKVENTFIEKVDKMVVVKSVFTIDDIYIEAFGGNDNIDLGDAYKGACTDALTKIGSYLGIGMDVFKGLSTAPTKQNYQSTPQTAQTAQDDNKPWIDDEKFSQSIQKLLADGKITKETPADEVIKILRTKFKVSRKYHDLVSLAIQ